MFECCNNCVVLELIKEKEHLLQQEENFQILKRFFKKWCFIYLEKVETASENFFSFVNGRCEKKKKIEKSCASLSQKISKTYTMIREILFHPVNPERQVRALFQVKNAQQY